MQLTVDSGHLKSDGRFLQKGWQKKRLSEISNIVNGYSFKSEDFSPNNSIQSVKITNVGVREFIPETSNLLPEKFLDKYSDFKVFKGDIVIALTRSIISNGLKVALVPDEYNEALLNQRVAAIKPNHTDIIEKFLFFYFGTQNVTEYVKKEANTLMQPNLSIKSLKSLLVPIPPLPEQKRIVAILDEAFEGIDRAIANTEKNLANSRELFESYLNAIFTQKGDGWEEKKLEDICSIISKLVDPRRSEFLDLPHVGAGNMISMTGELIEVKTAREEELKSAKFLFDKTMVLYSKIRPYLMKACRPEFSGLCSADVYPLLPNDGQLNRDFLFHLLMSRNFTDYAISGSDRAGMPKVNRDHLFRYSTWIPSLSEQINIAQKIDEIASETQRLEAIYRQKIAALNELKQSILQKAFTGELTADNANQVKKTAKEVNAA